MDLHLVRMSALAITMALTLYQVAQIARPRPLLFRLLGALTTLAFCLELAGVITGLLEVNNTRWYNLFMPVEMALVLAMVRTQRPRWTPWLVVAGVGGAAMLLASMRSAGDLDQLLVEGILGTSLTLAVVIGSLLTSMALNSAEPLQRVPAFWLFMGLLAYFGCLAPVVGVSPYLYQLDPQLVNRLWSILPLLGVIRYLLAAQSARMQARKNHG